MKTQEQEYQEFVNSKARNLGYVESAILGMQSNPKLYPAFPKTFDGCYDCIEWLFVEMEQAGQFPLDGQFEWSELVKNYFTPCHKQVDRMLAQIVLG